MKYFFRLFLIIGSVCLISLVTARAASAHVLKVDGTIGVVLHVDPGDEPVAGEQTNFYFEIKDKQNKFTPEVCDCVVDITRSGGESVYKARLFTATSAAGLSTPALSFVFPSQGVYKVMLTGNPKQTDAFQGFSLSWDQRVDKGLVASGSPNTAVSNDKGGSANTILYIAGAVGVLAILIGLLRKGKSKHIPPVAVLALIVTASLFTFTLRSVVVAAESTRHNHVHVGIPESQPHDHVAPGYAGSVGCLPITTVSSVSSESIFTSLSGYSKGDTFYQHQHVPVSDCRAPPTLL